MGSSGFPNFETECQTLKEVDQTQADSPITKGKIKWRGTSAE